MTFLVILNNDTQLTENRRVTVLCHLDFLPLVFHFRQQWICILLWSKGKTSTKPNLCRFSNYYFSCSLGLRVHFIINQHRKLCDSLCGRHTAGSFLQSCFCNLQAVIIYVDRNWETVTDVGMVAMETHNHVRLFSGTAVIMAQACLLERLTWRDGQRSGRRPMKKVNRLKFSEWLLWEGF